jgi:phosphinothricin acetyltransferase
MPARIDKMLPSDWIEVESIYREGIATGNATFATDPPTWKEWDLAHLPSCRLVAKMDSETVGWAAASSVSSRCVYAGVAEISIYVSARVRGQGVGKQLLNRLIEESEQNNLWTLQAGIFPENLASIALHRSCGFREVGRRERLGSLNGVWRDVLLFERRSRLLNFV